MSSPTDKNYIPIIDFEPFLHPSNATDRRQAADAVFDAFKVHGFVYLKNHGVPAEQITTAFAQSASFFDSLATPAKERMAWTTPAANRGFSRMGLERVSQVEEADRVAELRESNPDLKESFEIGREGEPDYPNFWPTPSELPTASAFKSDMLAFHDTCANLHKELMRALALALGIDEHWFDAYTRRHDNTLRLLHYPRVRKAAFAGAAAGVEKVRAGAHTDFGSLTLLFQDAAGGLQVQGPDRATWIDATPVAGTIVVNAADLLARWTNGVLRSTLHRVMEPRRRADSAVDGPSEWYPPRYSIAYFCNPDFDRDIDVVPGTLHAGEERKFDVVNSGEYLVKRLSATY